jgi:uncharacterized protein (TIGR02996 family)
VSDEAEFLAAIRTRPGDNALLLVYADWLDEHGELQRSELIRVCEAMRGVPVFSDDYWRLKARRNELRSACPADWIVATGCDGSRYEPLFRDGFPLDLKGRWRLIREFTERWHGVPMGDVGGRLPEVRATEERLGRQLPASVREYVAYTHDVAALGEGGIAHRDDITMELGNGPSGLTIMVWKWMQRWDIPYAELCQEDPPVSSYCVAYDDDDTNLLPVEGTGPEAQPLSDFAFAVADDYKPESGRFWTWAKDDRELRKEMDGSFPIRVAHHRTKYTAGTTIVYKIFRPQATIYEGTGILAWLHDSPSHGFILEVCAHSSLTREAIPGFLWEYAQYPEGIFRTKAEAEPDASADGGGMSPF